MTFLPINGRIALVKKKKSMNEQQGELQNTNYVSVAPRSYMHKELTARFVKSLETAGTKLRTIGDANLFKDREDMKDREGSRQLERAMQELFGERMKHNELVFKSDILEEEEKPKKKLKKAADSDEDLLKPANEDEDNDIIHSDEGLTPNEDDFKKND